MNSSIRSFIRMILLEGSESTGMSTSDWWKSQGDSYQGSAKDMPYYVYKDPSSGLERSGSIKFPGDPFTYEDVGGGQLRVLSGPNPDSIGSVFQASARSDLLKKADAESASSQAPAQKQSIDEIIRAIGKHMRLTALYLARSISYGLALKHACLRQKPMIFLTFANDLVKYTTANHEAMENLFSLLQGMPQNKIPSLANVNLEAPSDTLREASALIERGSFYIDYNESVFHLSRLKSLIKALKSKGTLKWEDVGPDASDAFIAGLDVFMDTKRFIDSVAVRKALIANVIAVDPERGQFTTSIYGSGGAREILSFEGEEWTFDELKVEMTDLIKEIGDDH